MISKFKDKLTVLTVPQRKNIADSNTPPSTSPKNRSYPVPTSSQAWTQECPEARDSWATKSDDSDYQHIIQYCGSTRAQDVLSISDWSRTVSSTQSRPCPSSVYSIQSQEHDDPWNQVRQDSIRPSPLVLPRRDNVSGTTLTQATYAQPMTLANLDRSSSRSSPPKLTEVKLLPISKTNCHAELLPLQAAGTSGARTAAQRALTRHNQEPFTTVTSTASAEIYQPRRIHRKGRHEAAYLRIGTLRGPTPADMAWIAGLLEPAIAEDRSRSDASGDGSVRTKATKRALKQIRRWLGTQRRGVCEGVISLVEERWGLQV